MSARELALSSPTVVSGTYFSTSPSSGSSAYSGSVVLSAEK